MSKNLVTCVALAFAATVSSVAHAAYPDRAIRIIVPYAPGGGADTLSRLIGQKLSDSLGQPIIVENRPGADTQIGTSLMARADADGYTLGMVTPTVTINKTMYPKSNYDLNTDLRGVALVGNSPFFLVVNPNLGVKSVADLVELAKADPGKLNYSASSSITFVTGEAFKSAAGIDVQNILYKGSAPSVTAVASGEVAYAFDTVIMTKPFIDSGKLRVLGLSTPEPLADFPEIPTMDRAGINGFDFSAWYGIVAPSGVPDDIVRKLNAEINQILKTEEFKNRLADMGAAPAPMSSEEFDSIIKRDIDKYGELIKSAGLVKDN